MGRYDVVCIHLVNPELIINDISWNDNMVVAMKAWVTAAVFWDDGSVLSARSKVFLDTDVNKEVVDGHTGTLPDGREVVFKDDNWVCEAAK